MDADHVASIGAIASLAVALVSLVVALVALRFAVEQARAYLFPVPMVLSDIEKGTVVLRNLGGGPMVDVWIDLLLFEPAGTPITLQRHLPSVAAGEQHVIIEADLAMTMALAEVRASIRFENLRGSVRRCETTVMASQLAV